MKRFTARPELSGTFGAVASTHWIASAVGMRLLEAGGNAFDAAAAAGFTLQVVEPHLNGPGGDAPIIVARTDDEAPTVICGQGVAPAAATIEHFQSLGLDLIPATGLLAACVPGAFGAWLTMLRDWGTVPLRQVLEPAIHYARHGHPLLSNTANTIASVRDLFVDEWRSSAAIFLHNDETPQAGSLFANSALADFYQRLLRQAESASSSREGQIDAALRYWYEGEVAEIMDDFCRTTEAMDVSGRRHGGLLRATDMAGWRPPIEQACGVDQGDYTVYKCGAWSQGPSLLQALRILDGFDIGQYAPTSPDFVHLVTETLKLVMADRDAYYGDDPDVPLETLLSRGYADERRALISDQASMALRPGAIAGRQTPFPPVVSPGGRQPSAAAGGGEPTMARTANMDRLPAEDGPRLTGDTCHVDVVDRWGNMVSATPSGGWLQSSPVVPALGFPLGTRMQMFWLQPGLASSLRPGRRPRTTLTPSMAFRHGRPYLAFGTPGGDQQDQWSLLLWLYHRHCGLPLQAAIETPAFHTDHMLASFWPREAALGTLIVEGRYPQHTLQELRRRGHAVTVGGDWSEGRLSACAFDRDGDDQIIRAAANPRGMQGYAVAR
ncbi:gamma-glutamyltransferase family protein [Niveispirillum fermenti]|uniref:gamma-glutamyltransferase family protein n=1 Tax=Niveispirillum fermenti TaxID=1233113 RepID=UPI0040418E89